MFRLCWREQCYTPLSLKFSPVFRLCWREQLLCTFVFFLSVLLGCCETKKIYTPFLLCSDFSQMLWLRTTVDTIGFFISGQALHSAVRRNSSSCCCLFHLWSDFAQMLGLRKTQDTFVFYPCVQALVRCHETGKLQTPLVPWNRETLDTFSDAMKQENSRHLRCRETGKHHTFSDAMKQENSRHLCLYPCVQALLRCCVTGKL